MRRLATIGVCLCLWLLPAMVGADRPKAEEPERISIGLSSNSFVVGGLRIAEKAGLFKKNGLTPSLIVLESGNSTIAALLSRSANFAATGPTDALTARARGQDVVLVANLYRGYAGAVVISKDAAKRIEVAPDSPVAARLNALSRLRIAGPSATAGYTTVVKNAAEAGGSKLNFIYMAQPAMPAALATNAIDAFSAGPPFWGAAVAAGTGTLWIAADDLPAAITPSSSAALQTTASYAQANPEIMKRMLRVISDLGRLIRDEPDKALAALAEAYPSIARDELDFAFRQEAKKWTQPDFTTQDMAQEINLFPDSPSLPLLKSLDPQAMIYRPNN